MMLAAGVMRPGFPNVAISATVAYGSQQNRKQITITTTMIRMRCSRVRPIPLLMPLTWVGKRHEYTISTAHTGSRRSCVVAPGVAARGAGWNMAGSSEILLAGEELANVGRGFSGWYRTIGTGLAIVLFTQNSLLQLSSNYTSFNVNILGRREEGGTCPGLTGPGGLLV